MDRIASIFKQQRELLGLSLEDLSIKTKLSIYQLQAIEAGKIEFFKDDITYFPFMIRFVANTLQIDYDSIKPDVEQIIATFHNTQALKKVQQREIINHSVKQKTNKLGLKKKKSIDYTFISLMLLLATLVIALVITFFTVILPRLSQEPKTDNPQVELPNNPNDDVDEEPTDPVDPEIVLAISEVTYNTYTISNFDPQTKVTFKVVPVIRQAWIRFALNNTVLTLPATAIYPVGQEVILEHLPTPDDEINIRVGDMVANNVEFFINDVKIILNARFNTRASNGGNAGALTFKFIGE
ncbi:MAG: helix-turn-helix domain-containing protein [Erysipelothrix sp.]|nr:helix-turn-helix domain-containing protein [Erysipelothrix sp.]